MLRFARIGRPGVVFRVEPRFLSGRFFKKINSRSRWLRTAIWLARLRRMIAVRLLDKQRILRSWRPKAGSRRCIILQPHDDAERTLAWRMGRSVTLSDFPCYYSPSTINVDEEARSLPANALFGYGCCDMASYHPYPTYLLRAKNARDDCVCQEGVWRMKSQVTHIPGMVVAMLRHTYSLLGTFVRANARDDCGVPVELRTDTRPLRLLSAYFRESPSGTFVRATLGMII